MSRNNEIHIEGNIGKEPDFRYSKSGIAVLRFSVGVNKSRKDNNGNWQTETTWFPCAAFKDLAENAAQEIHKGVSVNVIGEMKLRRYEKDGVQQVYPEIAVETLSKTIYRYKHKDSQPAPPGQSFNDMGQPDNNEEIPF